MPNQYTQYFIQLQLTAARLVSTGNLAGSYYNGPLNNGIGSTLTFAGGLTTVDSVTLNVNDRVLLVGQTNKNENGIYIVNVVGTPALLTRSQDFQNIEQIKEGQFIPVAAGSVNAGAMYVVTEPLPAQFGINDLVFSPTSVPSGGTFLVVSNNLSDVLSAATSRTNLGAQTAANIKAGTTGNIGGAGAGPIVVTVAGLTTSSVVVADIASSSNPASVIKCIAGTGNFSITFSADPGASCIINYVAFIAAQ